MSCWKFLSLLLVFVSSDALECDLYIAESTIPNAGLGVFSTVEKKVGDNVGKSFSSHFGEHEITFHLSTKFEVHKRKEDIC